MSAESTAKPASGTSSAARLGRPLLQVDRLSKLYPLRRGPFVKPTFVHAVEGVSFSVRRGETLGLVGESGCGKSTLARTILRLSEPTAGRVVFDGTDITQLAEFRLRAMRRRMQIVFQDPYASLNPRMTVREIVGEGISIFGLAKDRAEADSIVEKTLLQVGLRADMMQRYPHEFSGGQRQRIGIARALAVKPEFLVCDEPISALDVSVQAQIMNLLSELQSELSLTMLFISHDLRATAFMSHRIAVMYLGRIVEIGPVADVYERRYHPYTRALFHAMPKAAGAALSPLSSSRPASSSERTPLSLPPTSSVMHTPVPGSAKPVSSPIAKGAGLVRRLLIGEAPSAVEPPKGCVFYSRCPKADPGRCDKEAPALSELVAGSQHRVACWFPENENLA